MAADILLIGTHRRPHRTDPVDLAHGLYLWRRDGGVFATEPHVVPTAQPGWIAAHPSLRVVYAVNEVREHDGIAGGAVTAFALDANGGATPLGSRATPAMPCHCTVDATGNFLLVATFGGGSVHLFPLGADGAIGTEADRHDHRGSSVHPRRQTEPHAHAVVLDPANRFALVPDLGTDRLVVYELDGERGRLVPHPDRALALPPGSGPRHVVFSADARFVYLMNEMSASVAVLGYDATIGGLSLLQTLDLLPTGFTGHRSGAAIALGLDGRFLYATTRSHGSSGEPPERGLDSLAWCRVDAVTGRLDWGGRVHAVGEIPRSFIFDATGTRLLVGNQASGTVTAFDLDPASGEPLACGVALETPVPVCLLIVPAPDEAVTGGP